MHVNGTRENTADDDDMDPLDAYMATLNAPAAATGTTAEARQQESAWHARRRTDDAAVLARNRRFKRLQQLLAPTATDDEERYFSDAMMQQRHPALYHFYLGQYQNVASRQARAETDNATLTLSSFLMDTYSRREMEARRVAEQQTWGPYRSRDDPEDDEEKEEEEEEEEEDDEDETKDGEELTLTERREQLIDVMSQRFLDGLDADFVDYVAIDTDKALDDVVEMERDAHDRYFDESD